ncbi:MAG TPA: hypothetical protein DDW27_14445 [Bacteroidales bacterium]|nr:hypothetical protein [Bacteroidales bacterium]
MMNTKDPNEQTVSIRMLNISDLEHAICLSVAEGWNQTEMDWRLLIENPYNTCLAAEYDGRVIGTATSLNHSDNVAWIGMVIVDKAFRGRGIGKLLMAGIIDKLVYFESVKLDATPAGLPLYRKLGFVDEYMIDRMVNPAVKDSVLTKQNIEATKLGCKDYPVILKTDEKVFGTYRGYLIGKLYSAYPEKTFILKSKKGPDSYIFGRDGIRYNYLGPLIATSDKSARILISKALESLVNQPVVLDILQDKKSTIKWLESLGFEKQRHFTRMYLNSNSYKGIIKKYYLISGPEYG